jgi:hypothetical protein
MKQKLQTTPPPTPNRQALIQEALRIQAELDDMSATAYLMRAGLGFADALRILLLKHK